MKIILLFVFFSFTYFSFSQSIEEKIKFTNDAVEKGIKNDIFKYESDIIENQKQLNIDSNYIKFLQFYREQYYSFHELEKAITYQVEICGLSKNIYRENSFKYLESINILRSLYWDLGDYQKSLELNLECLKLKEKVLGKEHLDYLWTLDNLVLNYLELGDYQKSLELNLECLKLKEKVLGKEHLDYLWTLDNLVLNYLELGDYQKSLELNLECLKLKEKVLGKEHPDYLWTLDYLVINYSYLGDYQKSLELNIECLNLKEKVLEKEHPDYLRTLGNLAHNYTDLGFYEKSLELNLECLKLKEKVLGKEHPDYLNTLGNLALSYSYLGDYQKSLELNLECLNTTDKVLGKEHPNYLLFLNNIADNYSSLGDYQKSLEMNIECLKLKEKVLGKEHPDYLWTLGNLALNYSYLGDYQKSFELNQECLRLKEKVLGKEHPSYLVTLGSLALNYSELGDYEKSFELNQESLKLHEKVLGKEHPNYIITLDHLANNYSELGDYHKALELNQECLIGAEKLFGKEGRGYLITLNNLAYNYSELGDYEKSLELNLECLNIREKVWGKEHPNYLMSLNNLANNYSNIGDYQKSLELNQECLRLREKVLGKGHPDYLNTLNNLGSDYIELKKFLFSDSIQTLNLELQNEHFKNNSIGLNEGLKLTFKNNLNSTLEDFINYSVFRKKDNPKLLEYSFKTWLNLNGIISNQTTQLQEQVYASHDTSLISLYEDWKLNKLQLMKYYELTIPEREERGLDLKAYESIIEQQEQELSRLSDVFSDMKKEYSIEDIKMNLKDDEVYIDIIALPYFNFQTNSWTDTIQYLAYIINNKVGESPATVLLENGNQLEGELFMNYANSAYGYNKNQQSPDALSYNYFWKPIAEEIKGKQKVYVSLGGVFNKLNLETLYNPSTNNYLIDELDIEMVNNGRSFIQNKIKGPKNYENFTATLVGFPNYNGGLDSKDSSESDLYAYSNLRDIPSNIIDSLSRGGFNISSLPGTKIEVESISEILKTKDWKVNVLMEDEATEDAVKEVLSPRILHIATHGYFFKEKEIARNNGLKFFGMEKQKVIQNPLLRSGLLLAGANSTIKGEETNVKENGILTAYEASYLNLKETELVVLSACETGRGDVQNGEGVYGLRKSISDAGAQNIIMSLWKVDDKVTQEFMSTFYENWLSGTTIREAFTKTQHFIKDKYPQPYYWGAFVLIGE